MADLGAVAEIAGYLGSAVASFLATWAALVQPLKRKMTEPSEELGKLAQKIETLVKESDEARRKIEKLEDRMHRTIMDDEFAAYVSSTTQAVQNLTKEVGQVTGALEASWRTRRT